LTEISQDKFCAIFTYQFGSRVHPLMNQILSQLSFTYSRRTGRFKTVLWNGQEFCNFKPDVGLFALGQAGASFLIEKLPPPSLRVIVQEEIGLYISEGRNVFAKHVVEIDPVLLPEDEVIIVDTQDHLLGVGRLLLPPIDVKRFKWGVAVKTRKGFKQ
jgi:archaeosine-15-forming tRNA-guanine transglycosylase